jgi:hypothetical protein
LSLKDTSNKEESSFKEESSEDNLPPKPPTIVLDYRLLTPIPLKLLKYTTRSSNKSRNALEVKSKNIVKGIYLPLPSPLLSKLSKIPSKIY